MRRQRMSGSVNGLPRHPGPAPRLDNIVKPHGARLRYLPPYSPHFNHIELAFSKLKTWLRTAQARTRDLLAAAILAAA